MSYAGVVRAFAMGVLLAAITACGGGGSGGGNSRETITQRPNVPLPDISTANQKVLTPNNSRSALIRVLTAIRLVESYSLSIEPAVDIFSSPNQSLKAFKVGAKSSEAGMASKTVDVSNTVCDSGSAIFEGPDGTVIGHIVERFTNCDTGEGIYDGVVQLDIRDQASSDVYNDVTYTFSGLRFTSGETDMVMDGTIVVDFDYPGPGSMAANVDIRDLKALKAIRLVDFRMDFIVDYSQKYQYSYVYYVTQRSGRLYDEEGEYVDIGVTPGELPWPMLVGGSSRLMVSPSGMSSPYQLKVALDADADENVDYWLFADLDQLSASGVNTNAPEFYFNSAPIRLDKGQTQEVLIGNVTDADHQFVSINWQLAKKPAGSDPIIDAWSDGFMFSSNIAGDYRVDVTASDGMHTVTRDLNIRVMYDMPEINANAPQSIGVGDTAHFAIDVLNPSEGNVQIIPVAMPGLSYDSSGGVTYTPVIPNFGADQQVNLLLNVRNEDHEQQVAFPITIKAENNAGIPLLLATHRSGEGLPGNFDGSGGYEEARKSAGPTNSDSPIAIFKREGGGQYRYQRSYDLDALSGATNTTLLGANDFDGDGIDEIIFAGRYDDGNYIAYFNTISGKIEKKVFTDDGQYSIYSTKERPALQKANIDATGGEEFVLFVGTGFIIFDDAMNLLWETSSTAYGYYGYSYVIVNVDADSAQEIVTEEGFVLDGNTRQWQQKFNFNASGKVFFATDVDGDGQKELYFSDATSLHRVAQNGDAIITNPTVVKLGDMESNVLAINVDSDPVKELVWVSHSDADRHDSLVYLDYVSGVFEPEILHDVVADYFGDSYQLEYQEGKISGTSTFFSTRSNGSQGFVYDPVDESLIFHGAIADISLGDQSYRGNLHGGTAISEDNKKLIFCGLDNQTIFDLFSYDIGASYLDADTYTMVPDASGYGTSSWDNVICYGSSLGKSGQRFIVSAGFMQASWGGQVLAAKVQKADGSGQVFHVDVPSGGGGPLLMMDGNVAGDSAAELIVAQGSTIWVYDIFGQQLLGTLLLRTNEIVGSMDLSPPTYPGEKSKIAITTGDRVLMVEFKEPGELLIAGETPSRDLWGLAQPVAFSGNLLLVGRRESTGAFTNDVFHVDLYDSKLQHTGEWITEDSIRQMKVQYLPDGSSFVVSVDGSPGTMKWRDPATGRVMYSAPDAIPGTVLRNVADFHLFFDAPAHHVSAVIDDAPPSFAEMADRIVITL